MKKISILITTYNTGEIIYSCIDGLLKQNHPNYEIIVLDGGSKDETMKHVRFQQKQHPSIRVYEKRYTSLATLRRWGISLATGELIIFVLPEDILNQNALRELALCLEENDADVAIGSFKHPLYKGCLKNQVFHMKSSEDFRRFFRQPISNAMLTGKLYKKSLFENVRFKDAFLNEEMLQLGMLKYIDTIVTTEKILTSTQEHCKFFIKKRFWENKQSFFFQALSLIEQRETFYQKNKKIISQDFADEFIYLPALNYLFWEILAYASKGSSLESLAMELYTVLKDEVFLTYLKKIPAQGLQFKEFDDNELLACSLLFSDIIYVAIKKLLENAHQIDVLRVIYMIFLRIFYQQNGILEPKEFLSGLRDELNLNETIEARMANSLNI